MKLPCAPQVWGGKKNDACSCPKDSYSPASTVYYCWALPLMAPTKDTGIPLRKEKRHGKSPSQAAGKRSNGPLRPSSLSRLLPGGSSGFPEPLPVSWPQPAQHHGTGTQRGDTGCVCLLPHDSANDCYQLLPSCNDILRSPLSSSSGVLQTESWEVMGGKEEGGKVSHRAVAAMPLRPWHCPAVGHKAKCPQQ